VAGRVGIRSLTFYGMMAVAVWYAFLESGVHATLAGVAVAFLTPASAWYSNEQYRTKATTVLASYADDAQRRHADERIDASALDLASVARESVAPLDRMERALHPWTSFAVVPLFALANAGVRFTGVDIGTLVTHPVTLAVTLGLVAGKSVGIVAATWLAVRSGIGVLPPGTGWRQVFGLATLAGIGFTVSMFISELAFADRELVDAAKLGIFAGSLIAAIVGCRLLMAGNDGSSDVLIGDHRTEP